MTLDALGGAHSIRVRGSLQGVQAARNELKALQASVIRHTIGLNPSVLPFLLGQGGSRIKQLEGDYGVSLQLDRDKGRLLVRGTREGVQGLVDMLAPQLQEQEQVEQVVYIMRSIDY
ncbi:hypothetical protein EON64_16445, partial [archaeon]